MPKKEAPNVALTYVIVFFLLMFLLILFFPHQTVQFISALVTIFENLTSFGQIIIVAIVIGVIVYLLKRAGKI